MREGLAVGRMAGGRHTATTEGKISRGGNRERMEYNHALATSNIHSNLLDALNEHEGGTASNYAFLQMDEDGDASEDEDN